MRRLLPVLLVAALPAFADEPLSGAEFEAHVTGKTLTYAQDGVIWGREQYEPGRQVIWAFEGQDCKRGSWTEPEPALICFEYQDEPGDLECWRFFRRANGLTALSDDAPDGLPLAVVEETADPMACTGPDLGV